MRYYAPIADHFWIQCPLSSPRISGLFRAKEGLAYVAGLSVPTFVKYLFILEQEEFIRNDIDISTRIPLGFYKAIGVIIEYGNVRMYVEERVYTMPLQQDVCDAKPR